MTLDPHTALALLEWQIELGADEALLDLPVNRFELEAKKPAASPKRDDAQPLPTTAPEAPQVDAIAEARAAAAGVADLEGLRTALARYPHCELKLGAQNLVFADGDARARVMVIGEAPGRDEDRAGRPFVGRAGQLLDKMFAAIGMGRQAEGADALYITNILPWRPPQNRDPSAEEIAMMRPFMDRHIELAAPEILVLMGNISCQAMLGRRGITRLRGQWQEVLGRSALPMFHPAYLLRNPGAKREAWADLLSLKARLG